MPLRLTTYRHCADLPPGLPGSDTFHSTELMRAYEATPGYSPLMVMATIDGRPVARLLGAVQQCYGHMSWLPMHRCEVVGTGEYLEEDVDREFLFAEMLGRLTDVALRECTVVEFRNLERPMQGYKAFKDKGYFAVNWLRVRNSLHGLSRIDERFSASRIRQIRLGLRNGAQVRQARDANEVREFGRMLRGVYSSKLRRHFPDMAFFRHLVEEMAPGGQAKIFVVTYNSRVIGGSVCVYSGSNAWLWFSGGMRKTYLRQYPGILAVWAAFEDAHSRGFRHLEFMDVGLPFQKHGYREFVLRFGGQQLGTRRWFKVRAGWLNRLLSKLFE